MFIQKKEGAHMEELAVFAVLLSAKIIETSIYEKKLDAMFSACDETDAFHDILLHLEWEPNIT